MITEERVMTLLANANPEREEGTDVDRSATAYLATLQERSSEVTQLKEPKQETQGNSARGLRIAAFGVIGVVIVVAGLIVLRSSEEPATQSVPAATEAPVVTSVPTPTVEPGPEESLAGPAEVAVAERLVTARIAGDVDEIAAVMAGALSMGFGTSNAVMDLEKVWRDAVGWTIESNGCVLENPDLDNTQVDCELVHQTDIGRALGIGPFVGNFNVNVRSGDTGLGTFEDPVAYDVIDRFDDPSFINEVWRPFFDWVEVNYPDEIPIMFRYHSDGTPYVGLAFMTKQIYPSFVSDESVELWRERTAEYISEVTG